MCAAPGFVTYAGYTREQGKASVGEGWAKLVDRAFDAIPDDVKVVQVKEKFGTLHVYTNVGNHEMWEALDGLKRESAKTCERCGKPGKPSGGGWIRTLCGKCQ